MLTKIYEVDEIKRNILQVIYTYWGCIHIIHIL